MTPAKAPDVINAALAKHGVHLLPANRRHLFVNLLRLTREQLDDRALVVEEIDRVGLHATQRASSLRSTFGQTAISPTTLRATSFGIVEPDVAHQLHANIHYLGSSRSGLVHLGLYAAVASR